MADEAAAEDQQEALARVGARIASTLGELKGAAMKVGQMASMAADLLPKEIADALQSLQGNAPPVDFSVIEQQVLAEFDQPIELLFEASSASRSLPLRSARSIAPRSMDAR